MAKKDNIIRNNTKNNKFFSGVAVLSLSVVLVKAIGALFKIPMIKYIGIEGMGYFNAAYHFYSLLMSVSTAGLPVALSILISRDIASKRVTSLKRDYRCALILFCAMGALFSLAMFLFSDSIADSLGIPNTKYCLRAISPAVLLVSISGAVRGYFQGHSQMTPTAISQVIESLGKLVLGLGGAFYALGKNMPPYIVAAYAIFGLTLGLLASDVYLLISKGYHTRKYYSEACEKETDQSRSGIYSKLIKIAIPITVGSVVLSLTTLLDTLIIPNALISSGIEENTALNLYSTYTNLALPLFALPSAFITPVSLALVPAASYADESKSANVGNKVLDSSFRLCAFMTFPCVFGMGALSFPILSLVFSDTSSAIIIGARLLTVLSSSIFFSGLITVSNAMLQACKKQMLPIISLAVGAAVKLICEILLVSLPYVNIYGAPISTFFCTLTVAVLNFHFLSKLPGCRISPLKVFFGPLACSAMAVCFAVVIYNFMYLYFGQPISLIISILVAAALYIPMTVKSGALPKEDILLFPKGERICAILERLKLIKH